MYDNGNGVEKDFSKAAELYKKSCNGGEMRGCFNLGIMYAKGSETEKDFGKAAELFDLVKVEKVCDGAPRSFSDYTVTIDKAGLPANITVEELI